MISDSERRLRELEERYADLHIYVDLRDGSSCTIDGIDVKAFKDHSDYLGIGDFQMLYVAKAETAHYWNIKMLPTKNDDLSFKQYVSSLTYPEPRTPIRTMADIFPVVLYRRFIRVERMKLISDALGGKLVILNSDGTVSMKHTGKKTAIVESVEPPGMGEKRTHLSDYQ